MPERDEYLPPDFLMRPPKMGDQMELRPFTAALTNGLAEQCAFCGADLAHFQSAGLVVEYAGLKFCGDACLNSWIDGQAAQR